MEYTIGKFVESLRSQMYDLFPLMDESENLKKHKNRPLHIRDVAFYDLPIINSADGEMITFDIGSEYAEANYPYYHILEDAPYIRKAYRGTDKSKGSQDKVIDLGKRDYAKISWNGKTFSKEYQKNVRGKRAAIMGLKATRHMEIGGKDVLVARQANYYENTHYHYIEKMLEKITPILASEFGLKLGRTKLTSLEDDYEEQSNMGLLTDILDSMGE